ncbi:MAG: PAS domain-containing protein [Phycisphaerae bacterium]|nr:PAS domain-containing protein [Gemmatimonadaceae bacterium]
MPTSGPDGVPPDMAAIALAVVDHIPAMVAYWDAKETCRFANQAYRDWFGKSRAELLGTAMRDLLGPIYELNLPHIRGAIEGVTQVFERRIPRPDGSGARESLATYTPDIIDGVVRGFFVHVADTGPLKERERALEQAIAERDQLLAEVRTLRGLLSCCASCKNIRDETGFWKSIESYVTERTHAQFSHGLCPDCVQRLYPEYT